MGQKSSMYDLAWSIEGDSVDIEQGAGFGEVSTVTLHKVQLRMLASEMGLMHGDLNAWQRVATLERRLCILRDRIAELDGVLWATPAFPPDSGPSFDCTYSDATLTIADMFVSDLGAVDTGEGKPVTQDQQDQGGAGSAETVAVVGKPAHCKRTANAQRTQANAQRDMLEEQ